MDLMENVAYYNDLYDAVKVEVDAAIAQAGGAFGSYGLYETLPQTLPPAPGYASRSGCTAGLRAAHSIQVELS